MIEFEKLLMKHGEHGIQAILENWERFSGVRYEQPVTLERRWEIFLRTTEPSSPVLSAA